MPAEKQNTKKETRKPQYGRCMCRPQQQYSSTAAAHTKSILSSVEIESCCWTHRKAKPRADLSAATAGRPAGFPSPYRTTRRKVLEVHPQKEGNTHQKTKPRAARTCCGPSPTPPRYRPSSSGFSVSARTQHLSRLAQQPMASAYDSPPGCLALCPLQSLSCAGSVGQKKLPRFRTAGRTSITAAQRQ